MAVEIYLAAIRNELGEDHSYEFVQGNIEWPMAPELKDISDATKPHYACHKNIPDSIMDTLGALDSYLIQEAPFDGVLAFNQGAGLVLLYARYFLHFYPERALPFRCLLLFSPAGLFDPIVWLQTKEIEKLEGAGNTLNIPIAVIVGRHDLLRVQSDTEKIHELVSEDIGCWKYVHTGGHDIPNGSTKVELKGTVKALRRAIAQALIMAKQ